MQLNDIRHITHEEPLVPSGAVCILHGMLPLISPSPASSSSSRELKTHGASGNACSTTWAAQQKTQTQLQGTSWAPVAVLKTCARRMRLACGGREEIE